MNRTMLFLPLVLAAAVLSAPSMHAQDPDLERARRILSTTPLIDGHNDLAWAIREYEAAPHDVHAYDLRQPTPGHTDFARLREGMDVELRIGALPNAEVRGVLAKISLQGKTEDNATTFPVEVTLDAGAEESPVGSDIEGPSTGSVMLRAGYSANADIVIARRDSVLMLPERVVHFEGDSTWVEVDLGNGLSERRTIRTGLSDAIGIEILSGLAEGDRVREKPAREIE